MLNPIKALKKIIKLPSFLGGEVAPVSQSATIGAYLDPYTKILSNPDPMSMAAGGDFKIYAEVFRDDQVKSTFQQRQLAVVSKPWTVKAGADDEASKQAANALQKNLEAINFDDITLKQLFTVMYGYGVGEVIWKAGDGLLDIGAIKIRDRTRFRFDVEGGLHLIKLDFGLAKMPDRKFWVASTGADNSDNYYGVGLVHWLYWLVFFKRNDIKFWLIFLEKFGQPTATATLSADKINDKPTRDKTLEALRSIATEAAVILPDGSAVTLLEASRSGAADYEALKTAMDEAISKVVLSQTMTTDNGSSHSQSETHAGVRDMVVAADADMLCESFNNSVVQWWFEYNIAAFQGATRPRVYRDVMPKEDLNKKVDRDTKIYALGYEPTEEYIATTYGDGWKKRQSMPLALPNKQQGNKPDGLQNFSETTLLNNLLMGHRADQLEILNGAEALASKYEDSIGDLVHQLIDYADTSGDFETFRNRLIELMGDLPKPQTVSAIAKANFVSRIMGKLRAQK